MPGVGTRHQGTEFKKNNAPVSKEINKLRIIKLKDFFPLQTHFLYMTALKNTTFKQMDTNQFYNKRSFNTNQLKKRDFKTEKYGPFSILSQSLSD